jgi:hypothetical protein
MSGVGARGAGSASITVVRGRRAILAIILFLTASAVAMPSAASPPRGLRVVRADRAVHRLGTAQIEFRSSYFPTNPFDPAEVDYRAIAVAPDGSTRSYLAFWYQPFSRELIGEYEHLTSAGAPRWMVRIAPDVVGAWSWHLEGRDPTGSWRTPSRTLRVVASSVRGMVRGSPFDDRYLAYDDGSSYFAVGENLGWYDGRGTFAYDAWLRDLEGVHANFARLWMPSWAFGIEWTDTGLGDYSRRMDRAWQLDHVMDRAAAKGVQIELSLLNHGAFSTMFNSEWAGNPYNAANGGPIASPQEFFTDPIAKQLFRQRLRYIVARWGYAPNLLAWEFWNEVDLTDGFAPEVVAGWHREMSDFLRVIDTHHHLISSSTAVFPNEQHLWAEGGLDFAQVHLYARIGDTPLLPNLFNTVPELTALRRSQARIPVLFSELGVDSRGPSETQAVDPEGIGVHDGLWAGVVSGGFGTAMPWWWDNLTHLDWGRYGPMFARVRQFTRGTRFDREQFAQAQPTVIESDGGTIAARALVGDRRALVWVKDQLFQWNSPVVRSIRGSNLELELAPGAWCGHWLDTWTPRNLGRVRITGGTPSLEIPEFSRDLALRLRRC